MTGPVLLTFEIRKLISEGEDRWKSACMKKYNCFVVIESTFFDLINERCHRRSCVVWITDDGISLCCYVDRLRDLRRHNAIAFANVLV